MSKIYKTIIIRNTISIISIGILILVCTACGGDITGSGSMKAEDGRSYGGLIESELGKKTSTVFFDLTVDSAKKYSVFQFDDGLYQADEGNTYLVVTVTIVNTYDKDLPMSIADFTLDFSGNESDEPVIGFGSVRLKDESFMDNIYTLKKGESITKSILFTVSDKAEYYLCYKEYYEDEFEGDSYEISMVPEKDENELSIDASAGSATENSSEGEALDNLSDEGTTDNTFEGETSNNLSDEGITDNSSEEVISDNPSDEENEKDSGETDDDGQ